MTTTLTASGLLRRGIVASTSGLAIIAIVAAVVAATAVADPRVVTSVLKQDLHYRLATAGPAIRDFQSSSQVADYASDGSAISIARTVKALPSALTAIRSAMPDALRSIAGPGRYIGRNYGVSGHGILASGPPQQVPRSTYDYSIEANPELRTDAVLVSGSWPAPVTSADQAAPIQLVTTASAAKTLGWKVGQRQSMALVGTQEQQAVVLVGTIRPRDASTDYWQLDGSRERANKALSLDGNAATFSGTVWMDAASWPLVSTEFGGATLQTWFPITSAGLTVDQITALDGDLHRFLAKPRSVGSGNSNVQLRYSTNLGDIIDEYLDRAAAGNAVMTVVEAGPIGTGAALLLLAVLSLVERRRRPVALLRARGASQLQFRLEVAAQVAAATIPGAIVGAFVVALATGGIDPAVWMATLAVAVLPPVFAAAAAGSAPVALARGGVARPSRWRWVVDALLVLLAALAVVVLLQRGLGGSTTGLGTDPLLAATPLLIAAAACAIVLRIVPPVLRRLGRLIRRGRGVIGLVGRANSARAGARFLPVFAILTGLSVSIFAASILETEQTGIRDAAINQVGADISISGAPLPDAAVTRLRALPGVADLAAINSAGGANLVGQSQNVAIYTVDPRDLAAVEAVLPASQQLFADLGTTRDGKTVAMGGGFPGKLGPVSRFAGSKSPSIATDDVQQPPPKFIAVDPWLLLASAAAPKDIGLVHQISAVLIRVTPGTDQLALQQRILAITGTTETVKVTDTQVHALTGAPLVGGLEALTLGAVVLSLVLCVLALLLALVMGNRDREQVLGRLRALGFTRRQSTGLVGWEVGPMTVLGVVAGVIVGIALPTLFLTVVDLSTFIGATQPPALIIDPVFVGIAVVAFAASAVVAVVATSTLSARRRLQVLRESGE